MVEVATTFVGTVIAPEPSKFTPLIARGVASVVAVVALPESAPEKVVAVMVPVDGLNVKPVAKSVAWYELVEEGAKSG